MKSNHGARQDDLTLGLEAPAPGTTAQNPLSVTLLTGTIRELLETELGAIWVAGEISNLRTPASGHVYFTLKDAGATLAAVMFQREARRAGFALADGQAVLARGSITVYEARGQYQIQVAEIRPRGQGSLQQRFEELKRRLDADGLFALERKRPLPVFPETIGVVTSLQGAVLHDMLHVLQRRAPGIRIRVRGVRVQGPGAAQEIADAVTAFSSDAALDVLVVARGGGSLEDLWAFNEEIVARALAACAVPTISAVGHETDFTIADFVADLRAPTPSAAAELLTRDWSEWRQIVAKLGTRLERCTRQVLVERRRELARLASSYALREPRRVVRQWAQRLDDLRSSLRNAAAQALSTERQKLMLIAARLKAHHPARALSRSREHVRHLEARLRALGPQATLDRGYALVLGADGHPVRKAEPKLAGQSVKLVLGRGVADAEIRQADAGKTLLQALSRPGKDAKDVSSPRVKARKPKA